jgi:hypothetical protein
MCGLCNVWVLQCVLVLVICVLVFTDFCIVCTVLLYCILYAYIFLLVLSVLAPRDNKLQLVIIIIIIIIPFFTSAASQVVSVLCLLHPEWNIRQQNGLQGSDWIRKEIYDVYRCMW